MRILMVAPQPFFRPRGTPFSVLHRIRALLRLGHTVDLVTYPFGDSPELPGLTIYRAFRPPGVRDVAIGPSLAKIALDLPLLVRAYRLARTRRYELLHTHEEAALFGAWIARACGLRHLYDMHSSLPQQFSNFGRYNFRPVVALFERMERFALDRSDGVIAICPELRDYVQETGYPRPLALIENTLDFDPPPARHGDEAALRSALGLGTAPVALYAGTLESYQGLDLLLGATPAVLEGAPGTRFVILGGTPEQSALLRRDAQACGLDGAFCFVPAVPPVEVFRYYRIADVLVTCRSKGTNTPLKIYQYLRAGKPIVATAIRSHTQVLGPDCAELVEPTAEGIARGLLRVLGDPAHARTLAAGAVRIAEERYGERVYLERLRELLQDITRPRAGRKVA